MYSGLYSHSEEGGKKSTAEFQGPRHSSLASFFLGEMGEAGESLMY